MPSVKEVVVVSFNENEADAVDLLLDELAIGAPSPWQRDGETAIKRPFSPDQTWRLEHVALRAQGNVLAAGQLASQFAKRREAPDYVVFFGCAGAIDQADSASVFLVQSVNYLSLGTVESNGIAEQVTLKNKWLCHLQPEADVRPLNSVTFPLATGDAAVDLCALSGVPGAHVAATDKVVRVSAAPVPAPILAVPPHPRYAKAEWTYGQALGLIAASGSTVIVEMESYGIGCIAEALDFQERVVVLRVTTDALTDHGGPDADERQRELLHDGHGVLARVLLALLDPTAIGGWDT
jgi:hypothetical protein